MIIQTNEKKDKSVLTTNENPLAYNFEDRMRDRYRSQFGKGLASTSWSMLAGETYRKAREAQIVHDTENFNKFRNQADQFQDYAGILAPRVTSTKDVNSLGDAADFALGAVGGGVMSMAPVLASSAVGRVLPGGLGKLASGALGTYAGYALNKGEATSAQYNDPVLSKIDPVLAEQTATVQSIVAGGLDALGATKLLSKGGFLKGMMVEGSTEAAQEAVNFLGEKSLDPEREEDRWRFIDAFAAGALTGGFVSAGSSSLSSRSQAISEASKTAESQLDFVKSVLKDRKDTAPRVPADMDPDAVVGTTFEEIEKNLNTHDESIAKATPERAERLMQAPEVVQETKDYIQSANLSDPDVQFNIAQLEQEFQAHKTEADIKAYAEYLSSNAPGSSKSATNPAIMDAIKEVVSSEKTAQKVADTISRYDADDTTVYDLSSQEIANLRKIAEEADLKVEEKDTALSQVLNANAAEKQLVKDEGIVPVLADPEIYQNLDTNEKMALGKILDEMSLYDAENLAPDQVATMAYLDEVFGDRVKTMQAIDYYSQKNLPGMPAAKTLGATQRFIGADAPTLTFNNPRSIKSLVEGSMEPNRVREAIDMNQYAEESGIEKSQLAASILSKNLEGKNAGQLMAVYSSQGSEGLLQQFHVVRDRPMVKEGDFATLTDALGEAVSEYPMAKAERRDEIAETMMQHRQFAAKTLDLSSDPTARAEAQRALNQINEAISTMSSLDEEVPTDYTDFESNPDAIQDTIEGTPDKLPDSDVEPSEVKNALQSAAAQSALVKMTGNQKQRIIDEVVKLRGKDVEVLFDQKLGNNVAGQFEAIRNKDGKIVKRQIKLAMSALDAMSTAHHESLHDLIAMLDKSPESRKLHKTLTQVAQRNDVYARLKHLLRDVPEALETIKTDMEERIAYMYQFWQAGDEFLTLDQKTIPLMQRIKDYLIDLVTTFAGLGGRGNLGKAQLLFNAFYDGKFAEPSGFAKAVDTALREGGNAKVEAVKSFLEPFGEAYQRFMTTSTDQLRAFGDEKLNAIADLFQEKAGERKNAQGFLSARTQEYAHYTNEFNDLVQNASNDEVIAAVDELASMQDPSTELGKEIAKFFEKMYKYAHGKGVKVFDDEKQVWSPINKMKHFWPRYWKPEIISENKEKLINLIVKHHTAIKGDRESAIVLVNSLLDTATLDAQTPDDLKALGVGKNPTASSANTRKLTFINESNAHEFKEFWNLDMRETVQKYVYQMTHRAEYVSRFDNGGEKIEAAIEHYKANKGSLKDVERIRKIISSLDGSIGLLLNQRTKDIYGSLMTVQNLLLLPMTLFTSLVDPLGVAVRTGKIEDAWRAYQIGVKGIFEQMKKTPSTERAEHEKIARWLGAMDDNNMLDMMGVARDSSTLSKFNRKANAMLFRLNGLDQWTSSMRIGAIEAGRRYIVENRDNPSLLSEVGLTKDDVYELKPGVLALTVEEIMQANPALTEGMARIASEKARHAMFEFVDQSVVRPNAGLLPVWMKDPRFMLLAHLKQFTFAHTNVILARVKNQFDAANYAPLKIMALYVPFMLASDMVRGFLTGADIVMSDLPNMLARGVSRSGIMGTGSFYTDIATDAAYGKAPGTSLAGPTADHISLLVKTLFGGAGWDKLAYRSVPNVIGTPAKNFIFGAE